MSVFIRDFNLKSATDLGLVNESALEACDFYRDRDGNVTIVPAENKTTLEDIVLGTETKNEGNTVVMPKNVLKSMVESGLIKESALEDFDISIGASKQYAGMELAFIKPRNHQSLTELLGSKKAESGKSDY